MDVKPGFLAGHKTHIWTALGVITAAALWAAGELSTEAALALAFGGGYASTFRSAWKRGGG